MADNPSDLRFLFVISSLYTNLTYTRIRSGQAGDELNNLTSRTEQNRSLNEQTWSSSDE